MDILNNVSYVSNYHPVNVQAGIRTEPEMQGRGPDSVPPASNSRSTGDTNTTYDNTKTQGRYIDTFV